MSSPAEAAGNMGAANIVQQTPNAAEVTKGASGATNAVFGSAGGGSGGGVNTMGELRQKYPKVYEAMVKGIILQMMNQQHEASERLKKEIREGSRLTR